MISICDGRRDDMKIGVGSISIEKTKRMIVRVSIDGPDDGLELAESLFYEIWRLAGDEEFKFKEWKCSIEGEPRNGCYIDKSTGKTFSEVYFNFSDIINSEEAENEIKKLFAKLETC